jgi:glycosidase
VARFVAWLWFFSAAAAPVISKVEPPNWWVGHSFSTVRLMLRGSGLRDAQIRGARGLEILESKPNDTGTTLFVDVKVHRAGSYTLKVSTHDGSADAKFDALAPLAPKGRFQGFSSNDLIYMIMIDRFADGDVSNDKGDRNDPRSYHGGDFQGIIDHLGYLKDLGVTAIWITPVYENATAYHGYHAIDFYKVEEHFGTLDKLRELVDKAHQSGIKVILDMVVNHTGADHRWVKDPPLADWFHGTPEHHLNETFQIWTLLDPHAGRTMRDPVLDGWFADRLPDLNQEEPEVARYLIQNTLWWIASTGIDGIRADTMPYVPRQFWHDWNAAIHKEYPDFKTVGEVFDGDSGVVSFFQGGAEKYDGVDSGMDALFDFPLYGAVRRAFGQGKPVPDVAYIVGHDSLYTNPNYLVTFLGNHDVARFLNETGATADGLKLAFTYLFTTRGIPMIYSGDEIALRGGNDPDNRRDFPGGWKDDIRSAFNPQTRTEEERGLFDYIRKVALLRQQTPELRTGKLTQLGAGRDALVYTRGSLIVLINNGANEVKVQAPAAPGTWKNLLDVSVNVAVHERIMSLTVPARSAMIMEQR